MKKILSLALTILLVFSTATNLRAYAGKKKRYYVIYELIPGFAREIGPFRSRNLAKDEARYYHNSDCKIEVVEYSDGYNDWYSDDEIGNYRKGSDEDPYNYGRGSDSCLLF